MPSEQCSASIGLSVYARMADYSAKKSPKCGQHSGLSFTQSKVYERGGRGVGKGEKAFLQKGFSPFPANSSYPKNFFFQASVVFTRSWEIVMGPMPPGTGVMAEARGATFS